MLQTLVFLLFMGIVGAAIGWVTNLLAIRLLFRPYRPYVLPIFKWNFQGLIPKRQEDIAMALGNVVSTELITGADVALSLGKDEIKSKLAAKVEDHVRARVMEKMPVWVPSAVQILLADLLGKVLQQEMKNFLDNPAKIMQEEELADIRQEIRLIVESKVRSFDVRQLEHLTYLIAARELKHIERLGGILGFVIGVFQGLVTLLFF